jgi:hypothetical protein
MNIPSLSDLSNLISKVDTAVATFQNNSSSFLDKAESVLSVAGPVVADLFPEAQIAGFGVSQLLSVVNGVATAAPDLTNAYNNIKAAVTGGAAPTAEQWAAFDAAADQAHADFQAALAKLNAGS